MPSGGWYLAVDDCSPEEPVRGVTVLHPSRWCGTAVTTTAVLSVGTLSTTAKALRACPTGRRHEYSSSGGTHRHMMLE